MTTCIPQTGIWSWVIENSRGKRVMSESEKKRARCPWREQSILVEGMYQERKWSRSSGGRPTEGRHLGKVPVGCQLFWLFAPKPSGLKQAFYFAHDFLGYRFGKGLADHWWWLFAHMSNALVLFVQSVSTCVIILQGVPMCLDLFFLQHGSSWVVTFLTCHLASNSECFKG